MNLKSFSDAMSGIDDKYIEEAIQYQSKKKKQGRLQWGAMAACLCLVAVALATIPPMLEPDEKDGGGNDITAGSDPDNLDITPNLSVQPEIMEAIRKDMTEQDIKSWAGVENASLNFDSIIPVFTTANLKENCESIQETLAFDNQYLIPAVSNGECIGAATILPHEGKWTIAVYEAGFDLETEIENNKDSATCFIDVLQLNERGFLTITAAGEEYIPISGFGASSSMNGELLLKRLWKETESKNKEADGQK